LPRLLFFLFSFLSTISPFFLSFFLLLHRFPLLYFFFFFFALSFSS